MAACADQVRLWNLSDRAQDYVADLEADAKAVGVAFCYDRNLLASAYAMAVRARSRPQRPAEVAGSPRRRGGSSYRAIHPDCRLFVSSVSRRQFVVWDTQTWRAVKTFDGYGAWGVVSFSADGSQLFVPSSNAIEVWDTTTWSKQSAFQVLPLHVFALASSSDGRFVATAGTQVLTVWDVSSGQVYTTLEGHTDVVRSLAFIPGTHLLLSASHDATKRLWDVDRRRGLATLITPFGKRNEWAIIIRKAGSTEIQKAGISSNGGSIPRGWRSIPSKISLPTTTGPGSWRSFLTTEIDTPKVAPSSRDRTVPTLQIRPEAPTARAGRITVSIVVKQDRQKNPNAAARDLRLFRNGTMIWSHRGDVPLDSSGEALLTTSIQVTAGANVLSAYTFNQDNVKGPTTQSEVTGDKTLSRPGVLYVLAVGVSRYQSSRVAAGFSGRGCDGLRQRGKSVGDRKEGRPRSHTLTDEIATRENIVAALRVLAGGGKASLPRRLSTTLSSFDAARPEDAVLLFFSGHGRTRDGHFYFLPHDTNETSESDFSDLDLEQNIERIDAEGIGIVFDTCSSGSRAEHDRSTTGAAEPVRLQRLAYDKGVFFLSSSQTYEQAREYGVLGHGLLSYRLIVEGLERGLADREPRDGAVDLRELFQYAVDTVPELQTKRFATRARETQTPRLTLPRDAEQRAAILLARVSGKPERK